MLSSVPPGLFLSLAMLAVIALSLGGIRAMSRPAERTRGLLMLVTALVVLINVLLLAWPA
jgi:hypothetical protein